MRPSSFARHVESSKYAHEILRFQPIVDIGESFKRKVSKSSHNSPNQIIKDFIRKCGFCDRSYLQDKKNLLAIKVTISKFAAKVFFTKCIKFKGMNPMNPPTRVIMNFSLKLLTFRT